MLDKIDPGAGEMVTSGAKVGRQAVTIEAQDSMYAHQSIFAKMPIFTISVLVVQLVAIPYW